MKAVHSALLLGVALLFNALQTNATPLLGLELANFSGLAGGYATFGAGTKISNDIGAAVYITGGAGSSGANMYAPTITLGASAVAKDLYGATIVQGVGATPGSLNPATSMVAKALAQMVLAQSSLSAMTADTFIGATTASATFTPGVYNASALTTAAGSTITLDGEGAANPFWVFNLDTYLVTGAGTKITIINAGSGASVIWNSGYYTSLGASTSFIGAIFAGQYVSAGAGSNIPCGNVYAAQYLSLGASAEFTSTNCIGSATWTGSVHGMAAGLDIVNGVAVAHDFTRDTALPATEVPEPASGALMVAGLGLTCLLKRRRNH